MTPEALLSRLEAWSERAALIHDRRQITFAHLVTRVRTWQAALQRSQIGPGDAVAIEGDYSPDACALLLALLGRRAIAVPLPAEPRPADLDLAAVRATVRPECGPEAIALRPPCQRPPHYDTLIERDTPGLVLFSSGSTGDRKAAVHDMARLLEKFERPRRAYRTLTFLLLDHIGGINTLFYSLTSGGTVVVPASRAPEGVCQSIERDRVELLPTSPTFLNLLLASEAWRRFDLSSLSLVTYGTEVMPSSTLARIREVLPGVRLQQTYGLSEVGILGSQSRDDSSLWVRVGGEGFETRIRDGLLHVRARSAMLGYLNAPSPFDEDGWLNTQDAVEVDGDYIRILGRQSDLINVGGQKVYPAEVENVLITAPNVLDATVRGEPSPLVGQFVSATLQLREPEALDELRKRIRTFCSQRLPHYAVPVRITVADGPVVGNRFKKLRHLDHPPADAGGRPTSKSR